MGSLFYVNVPIREFEVSLRQKVQHITVNKEIENVAKGRVTGTGEIGTQSYEDISRRHFVVNQKPKEPDGDDEDDKTEDGGGTPSTTRHLTVAGHLTTENENQTTVDLYEAIMDGRKVNIVMSKDSMAIFKVQETDDLQVTSDHSDSERRRSSTRRLIKMKQDDRDSIDEAALQTIIDSTFLEKHLEDTLKKFEINNAKWGYSIDGNFAEVNFTVEAEKSESIIQYMLTLGIGTKWQSTLSVCAAIVFYNEHTEAKRKDSEEARLEAERGNALLRTPSKLTFAAKFKASIKSRLTVAQVIQTVQGNATMSFDFIILIIVAGIIAGLGLLENSPVSLVASMLISPLMGPIMAGCFGAVIHDLKLIKIGLMSELVGLSICVLVGFIFGICVTWAPFRGPWADIADWPTDEMSERAKTKGIIVGILVAIPSGAGVALSILAGNAGSLVGVAISASLLPPAVNAGLFWGMSAIVAIKESLAGRPVVLDCNHYSGPPGNPKFYTVNHTVVYCTNELEEFAIMGIWSFGLTLVNIILILAIGAIVLKIKEVAPNTTRKTMKRFWKEDLKVMRAYNRIHGSFNKEALLTELILAENSDEIKEDLANDHTFNQVNRRNLFGPSAIILNPIDPLQSLDPDDPEDHHSSEEGGGDSKRDSTQATNSSTGGGIWGGLAGIFSRNKAPKAPSISPPPNEIVIDNPTVTVALDESRRNSNGSGNDKEASGRPQLIRPGKS